MTEYSVIGIDIAKETFDVYIDTSCTYLHLDNSPDGHQQLLSVLSALRVKLVAMEATSRYHSLLAATLTLQGFAVAVVNPRLVKNFARATGTLHKTDPNDARLIC
ncbi:IS110 family transposase, partial [Pantoea endophytica]